jgi:hypothetical protein
LRRIDTTQLINSDAVLPLERPVAEALVFYLIRLALFVLVCAANLVLLGLAFIVARVPAALLLLLVLTAILIVYVFFRLKAHLAERPFPIFDLVAGVILGLLVAVGFVTLAPESWHNALARPRNPARFLPTATPPQVVVLVTEVKPTDTPTPPPDTPTPAPTATPTLAPTNTATVTSTPEPPTATPTATPTQDLAPSPPTVPPAPPAGALTLLAPGGNDVSGGPTSFEWTWSGSLPPELGFEVRVWREGELPSGVHDAVLDNREGRVEQLGENTYRLTVDIADAPGVQRRSGQYLWTVLLVRVSPQYENLGTQAEPATFRFESPGGGAGGG